MFNTSVTVKTRPYLKCIRHIVKKYSLCWPQKKLLVLGSEKRKKFVLCTFLLYLFFTFYFIFKLATVNAKRFWHCFGTLARFRRQLISQYAQSSLIWLRSFCKDNTGVPSFYFIFFSCFCLDLTSFLFIHP